MPANSAPRFADVSTAPPDPILGLTEAFAADKDPEKINLSVGVFKDSSGKTPILDCVKEAQRRIVESQNTQGYLPIDGMPDYRRHVQELVFGDTLDRSRIATLQTPGGTGALRVTAGFLSSQLAPIQLWLSNPTWANHGAVFSSENLSPESYRYLASDGKSFDFDGMIDDLQNKPKPGDAVLLHACCHNPTGVDPSPEQWKQIASVIAERRLLPLLDFAYQGFGKGIDEDAVGVRTVLAACDEAIVCNSFSKNFGLYSERVGALSLVAADADAAKAAQSQLKRIVRSNYSNPPRHGGSIVATVLDDAELTKQWKQELAGMQSRIRAMREQFVSLMKTTGAGHDFSFLLDQNGMFSFSGLNRMQVDELKNKHSIYIVGSGRINVAGMTESNLPRLCNAIGKVMEGT